MHNTYFVNFRKGAVTRVMAPIHISELTVKNYNYCENKQMKTIG